MSGAPPPGPPPGPPPSKPTAASTSNGSIATSVSRENPYLAHLPPSQRYTNGSSNTASGSGSSNGNIADPLAGFVPRKVVGNQVRKVLEGEVNPFSATGPKPYSQRYKDILAKRKALPVYAQMDEFYEKFNESQIMVMIGETGSGKTTQ